MRVASDAGREELPLARARTTRNACSASHAVVTVVAAS